MIVETSALVAILLDEPEAEDFAGKIRMAANPIMSAAAYVEAGIVADRSDNVLTHDIVDKAIAGLRIEIVPVTPEDARLARAAHTRFGRWSKSKANLNFGDCFSYALSERTGRALLYKGNDFGRTDVKKAL